MARSSTAASAISGKRVDGTRTLLKMFDVWINDRHYYL
jgi:hypothetical protein